MKIEYIIGVILLVLVGAGSLVIFQSAPKDSSLTSADKSPVGKVGVPYVEIVNPAGFVNTGGKPIKISDYVGKQVILLDIMTYSCINCQRTFPYVNAWYEKYKDDGLIVIGIHTPEFAFEKEKGNVEAAMQEFGIKFPVVLDNDYGTWNALKERFWPHKYLIDIHGNIVYDHAGEGAYDITEKKIQELLKDRTEVLGSAESISDTLAGSNLEEVFVGGTSPETYFGSARNELLANGTPGSYGEQSYVIPADIQTNALYLGGTWNISPEYAKANNNSVVRYRYNAKEVYLVTESETGGTIEVWQDGARVEVEAGADAPAGLASVKASRLYKLIKNPEAGEHTLELKVSPGVKLFAFTFG